MIDFTEALFIDLNGFTEILAGNIAPLIKERPNSK
jgi:hypothetical protein